MVYTTFTDVIRNWPGGPKGMATDLGEPVTKVSSWASKDILPVCYWYDLAISAQRRQFFGVDYHVLAKIASRDRVKETHAHENYNDSGGDDSN